MLKRDLVPRKMIVHTNRWARHASSLTDMLTIVQRCNRMSYTKYMGHIMFRFSIWKMFDCGRP